MGDPELLCLGVCTLAGIEAIGVRIPRDGDSATAWACCISRKIQGSQREDGSAEIERCDEKGDDNQFWNSGTPGEEQWRGRDENSRLSSTRAQNRLPRQLHFTEHCARIRNHPRGSVLFFTHHGGVSNHITARELGQAKKAYKGFLSEINTRVKAFRSCNRDPMFIRAGEAD